MLPELHAFGVILRQIGGRGHFRSRDKDCSHTIPSAISKNPMLYANLTTVSFIGPELLPIKIFHCRNREFRVFLQKIVEINFLFPTQKDVTVTERRLLSHKTRKSVKRCDLYRCARNQKVTGCKKNRHGWWQFHAYVQPPPLGVEIPKFACGVTSPT